MKKYCLYAIAVMVVMIAAPALAQEEMKGDMPEMPSYTVIMTETVKPGMTKEYEEGTKKLMETLKGMNAPFPVWAWQESNGTYNYGVPVESFAAIDQYAGVWAQAVAKLRASEWGEKRQAAIISNRYTIWYTAMPLSYMAAEPDMSEQEAMYSHIWLFRVKPKEEAAYNEAMMKMSAWMKETGMSRSYWVHRNIIGEEGPLYVLIVSAKDGADHWNYMKSMMEGHGEAFQAHKEEIGKHVVNVTEMFGWMRPDLSLVPGM